MKSTSQMGKWMAGLVVLCAVQPALAQECTLANARYIEPMSGLVLQFVPIDPQKSRAGSTSNMFEMTTSDGGMTFPGDVIWNMGLSRPNGSVLIPDCEAPESADDLNDCTLWEGVVYALSKKGIATLPDEDRAAPAQVLLSDFGRAMRYGIWDFEAYSGDIIADDIFAFDGCAAPGTTG